MMSRPRPKTEATDVFPEKRTQPAALNKIAPRGLYLAEVQKRNTAKRDIPRCGVRCTISRDGRCTRECWLPRDHSGGLSCDHACRNCWLIAPIDIKCVKDESGFPTIRPRVKIEQAEAKDSKFCNGKGPALKAAKPQTLEKVAAWFTADKKGAWPKRVHAIVLGARGERKCGCLAEFRQKNQDV